MNNAKKFKEVFGIYASELWAKTADNFLEWLNAPADDVDDAGKKIVRCKDCKYYRAIIMARIGEEFREMSNGCIHASVETIKVFPDHYCSFGVRKEVKGGE